MSRLNPHPGLAFSDALQICIVNCDYFACNSTGLHPIFLESCRHWSIDNFFQALLSFKKLKEICKIIPCAEKTERTYV